MKKIYPIITGALWCLFILLIILLKCVDVNPYMNIGLYSINEFFLPDSPNKALDIVSDICFYISFIAVLVIVGIGLMQLIKRKSLFKVDLLIYLYAGMLVLSVILYVLFDKIIVINNRPFITPEEPSFPSTHIFMTTAFSLGTTYVVRKLSNNKIVSYVGLGLTTASIILTFIGRILSRQHWFTDCLGGLILGIALAFTLATVNLFIQSKQEKKSDSK